MARRWLTKDFLDERLVPELESGTVQYFDHIRRYLFAQQFVQNKIVLDAACGTGYGSQILRSGNARQVMSIDISTDALSYAGQKWGARGFVRADAMNLPLITDSLDSVVSFETLEHLREPTRFLAEVDRVLKTDGDFILSVPNRMVASPGSATPFSPYHAFEPTLTELKMLLSEAGWRIIDLHGLSHSSKVEAIAPAQPRPFLRSGKQIAWAAYIRSWVQNLLPGALYQWQSHARHIPQFGIQDSVLTEEATERSNYFVVRCRR